MSDHEREGIVPGPGRFDVDSKFAGAPHYPAGEPIKGISPKEKEYIKSVIGDENPTDQ